jgi:Spy/CpxP family protein refolding chaperone
MKKVLLTVCLSVVFATPAFSQMNKPMGEHREGHQGHMESCNMCNIDRPREEMGDMMPKCLEYADKLGLTEEQINKVKPIQREMKKKQARYMADIKIAQMEMMEIMEVKDFDLDKATAAVKKVADIKTAHHLEMLKSMKEVHSILTDEQFKKMKKMMHMKMDGKKPHKKMMKKK